jgi:hypothetical protein
MFDNGTLSNTYSAKYVEASKKFPTVPENAVIGALSCFAFGNINIKNIEFLGGFSIPDDPDFDNSFGSFFNCSHIENVELPTTAPKYNYIEAISEDPNQSNFIGQRAFQYCSGIKYFDIPS